MRLFLEILVALQYLWVFYRYPGVFNSPMLSKFSDGMRYAVVYIIVTLDVFLFAMLLRFLWV